MADRPVPASGAVVWRTVGDGLQVLLVHRDRYDDWTFPKGKLDPGESAVAAAVREVEEETGVAVRLGPRLSRQEYTTARPPGIRKQVTYWCARPVDAAAGQAAETYQPNDEIDGVVWVGIDKAAAQLTYDRDSAVLADFERAAKSDLHRSAPLLILRHGHAKPRKTWTRKDRERPLEAAGRTEAERLVPMLAAYGVRVAVTSDARRCLQTVQPYIDAPRRGKPVRLEVVAKLSEEAANRRGVRDTVRGLLKGKQRTVLCTHRPVLPLVFDTLMLNPVPLEPGQLLVVHRRRGKVLGTELLSP